MTRAGNEHDILPARARELAVPLVEHDERESAATLLVFERGGHRYGVDSRLVMQVVPLEDYAPVPFAGPACMGIAMARGELVSLFDLPVLLGHSGARGEPEAMLLCGEHQVELAIAVDAGLDMLVPLVLEHTLDPAPCAGIDPRGFLVIDLAQLFLDPRLSVAPEQPESPS